MVTEGEAQDVKLMDFLCLQYMVVVVGFYARDNTRLLFTGCNLALILLNKLVFQREVGGISATLYTKSSYMTLSPSIQAKSSSVWNQPIQKLIKSFQDWQAQEASWRSWKRWWSASP